MKVDVIMQNLSKQGKNDFSVTGNCGDDFGKIKQLSEKVLLALGAQEVVCDTAICKACIGMRGHVCMATKMFRVPCSVFRVLSEERIHIATIAISEINTSVVFQGTYVELALRCLHEALGLHHQVA